MILFRYHPCKRMSTDELRLKAAPLQAYLHRCFVYCLCQKMVFIMSISFNTKFPGAVAPFPGWEYGSYWFALGYPRKECLIEGVKDFRLSNNCSCLHSVVPIRHKYFIDAIGQDFLFQCFPIGPATKFGSTREVRSEAEVRNRLL